MGKRSFTSIESPGKPRAAVVARGHKNCRCWRLYLHTLYAHGSKIESGGMLWKKKRKDCIKAGRKWVEEGIKPDFSRQIIGFPMEKHG